MRFLWPVPSERYTGRSHARGWADAPLRRLFETPSSAHKRVQKRPSRRMANCDCMRDMRMPPSIARSRRPQNPAELRWIARYSRFSSFGGHGCWPHPARGTALTAEQAHASQAASAVTVTYNFELNTHTLRLLTCKERTTRRCAHRAWAGPSPWPCAGTSTLSRESAKIDAQSCSAEP